MISFFFFSLSPFSNISDRCFCPKDHHSNSKQLSYCQDSACFRTLDHSKFRCMFTGHEDGLSTGQFRSWFAWLFSPLKFFFYAFAVFDTFRVYNENRCGEEVKALIFFDWRAFSNEYHTRCHKTWWMPASAPETCFYLSHGARSEGCTVPTVCLMQRNWLLLTAVSAGSQTSDGEEGGGNRAFFKFFFSSNVIDQPDTT